MGLVYCSICRTIITSIIQRYRDPDSDICCRECHGITLDLKRPSYITFIINCTGFGLNELVREEFVKRGLCQKTTRFSSQSYWSESNPQGVRITIRNPIYIKTGR